jgi:hypothetical protein
MLPNGSLHDCIDCCFGNAKFASKINSSFARSMSTQNIRDLRFDKLYRASGAPLGDAVPNRILAIIRASTPSQIAQDIIHFAVVKMPRLMAWWPWATKRNEHQNMNVVNFVLGMWFPKMDRWIANSPIGAGLQDPNRLGRFVASVPPIASHAATIRNLVTVMAWNWLPLFFAHGIPLVNAGPAINARGDEDNRPVKPMISRPSDVLCQTLRIRST